jgi:hypothetical protein
MNAGVLCPELVVLYEFTRKNMTSVVLSGCLLKLPYFTLGSHRNPSIFEERDYNFFSVPNNSFSVERRLRVPGKLSSCFYFPF